MKFLSNLNIYKKGNKFFTKSIVKGFDFFGEESRGFRELNATRSKLGAGLANGLSQHGIKDGSTVLYLGASHGYTPSFVSDMVGNSGVVFCLDFAPVVMRDLVYVCEVRNNMIPVFADANRPDKYKDLVMKSDVVFQDVSQRNQVEIFVKNCESFLKKSGFGILALKARSFDVTKKPHLVFSEVKKELDAKFNVVDMRDLHPHEKGHALFVVKKR